MNPLRAPGCFTAIIFPLVHRRVYDRETMSFPTAAANTAGTHSPVLRVKYTTSLGGAYILQTWKRFKDA